MDELRIIILAVAFLIAVLVLTTSKNGRKFRMAHKTGLYRASGVIRIASLIALLLFCAAALFTLWGYIQAAAGFVVIALSFLLWATLQFWAHSYVFIDDAGVTAFSPSGKSTSVLWKDAAFVSYSRFGIRIKHNGGGLYILALYKGFDDIQGAVTAHFPSSGKQTARK